MPPRPAILVALLFTASFFGYRENTSNPSRSSELPSTDASRLSDQTLHWARRLVKGGLDKKAAEKVAGLNGRWWSALHDADPKSVDLQLARLQKLGEIPGLTSHLVKYPESAGLLINASDPLALASHLAGPDYEVLAGLFANLPAEEDVDSLARALGRHKRLILRLNERGLIGAEVLFMHREPSEKVRVYEEWLTREFEKRLASHDPEGLEMATFYHFVLDSGGQLRDRLAEDEKFGLQFPELWRKLSRVVAADPTSLDDYLDEPGLWEALSLPRAEDLLKNWGPLAIRLLTGPDAYEKRLHPPILEALLAGDTKAVEALWKFRKERLFADLLGRDLKPSVRIACLQKLMGLGEDARNELRKMLEMNTEGLAKHVGPAEEGPKTWIPLYDAYVVVEKCRDGRPISTLDWVLAVADSASLVFPPAKTASTALGQGAKLTAKQAAAQVRAAVLKAMGKEAVTKLEHASARQVIFWGATRRLATAQGEVRRFLKAADRTASLDVTRAVRFAFQRSGLGRESFKRLTGLEARLFMRGDARVRVHIFRQQHIERLGKVAKVMQAFFDERPGNAFGELTNSIKDTRRRENLSAWWLMHACGQWQALLDQPTTKKPTPDR